MLLDGARPTSPSQFDSADDVTGTYSGGPTIQIITVSTSFLDPTLGFLNLLRLRLRRSPRRIRNGMLVARLRDRGSRDATIAVLL